jgi:hypothetical protein
MTQNTDSRISGTCTKRLVWLETTGPEFLDQSHRISGPVTQNFWLTQNHGLQIFWNMHSLAVILKILVLGYPESPQHFCFSQNTDIRISGTCTKRMFWLQTTFWNSHTEFLADTKQRIPDFLEYALTGCNSQNTNFRLSGTFPAILFLTKHRFQNIWSVHETSVFDSKQLVQNFWTSHTEFLADTKPPIPEAMPRDALRHK